MLTQNFFSIQRNAGLQTWRLYLKPSGLITMVLPYLFGIAGIILILNIIVSGYQMMTSAGEPKTMQAAQGKITSSIIGIVIILISFWIVNLIMNFFGLDFTKPITD